MNCPICSKEIGTTCNDFSHLISTKYTYEVYTGIHESHKYSITAPNLKIAFNKIFKIIGKPWKKDKRAGESRTYRKLSHRKGYPKDMFHYKVAWEPLTILIRRTLNNNYIKKGITHGN